ncbi:MAG: hypothetical protein EOP88_17280 [Verrucomicrobiaceae bacterium]|nr:MAG: hypothetical protein EOP88_17280 [Verrucomicrobiaceae bacterium]
MKTIITTALVTLLCWTGSATQADARSHRHSSRIYISGYMSCGTPIYRERYFCGYDPCGRPIWRTRAVRAPYRPRYAAPCPPPYRGGGHVVIQGSFYR